MNRRGFLAGCAGTIGSLAGCLDASPSSTTTPSSESEPPPTTSTRTPPAEYRVTDLSTSADTERPPEQYILHITNIVSPEEIEYDDGFSGEEPVVVHVADIENESIRDPIETAILDAGWQSRTEPSADLVSFVKRADVFVIESDQRRETHFELELYHLTPTPALAYDAEIIDETVQPGSPAILEFTLTNTSDVEMQVGEKNVGPFGVLWARQTTGTAQFLLWKDYDQESCVSVREDGVERCLSEPLMQLGPTETVSYQYEILPETTDHHPDRTAPPEPGTYSIGGEIRYEDVTYAPPSVFTHETELTIQSL